MTEPCCAISQQFETYRRLDRKLHEAAAESARAAEALQARLAATEAERDDWRTRAETLAGTAVGPVSAWLNELAEWRLLGRQILRDKIYQEDLTGWRWTCDECCAYSRDIACPDPYPHDPAMFCGWAARLLEGQP